MKIGKLFGALAGLLALTSIQSARESVHPIHKTALFAGGATFGHCCGTFSAFPIYWTHRKNQRNKAQRRKHAR